MLLPLCALLLLAPAPRVPQRVDLEAAARAEVRRALEPLRTDGWTLEVTFPHGQSLVVMERVGHARSASVLLPAICEGEVLERAVERTRRLLASFDLARRHEVHVRWRDPASAQVRLLTLSDVPEGFRERAILLDGCARFDARGDTWELDGQVLPLAVVERLWPRFVTAARGDEPGALVVEPLANGRWRGWAVLTASSIHAGGPAWVVPIDVDLATDECRLRARGSVTRPHAHVTLDLVEWTGCLPDGRVLRAFGLQHGFLCDEGRLYEERPCARVGEGRAVLVAGRLLQG